MNEEIRIDGERLADWIAAPLRNLWQMLRQHEDWPRDPNGLSSWLYSDWYTGSSTRRESDPLPGRLVARLRAAHAASQQYEPGWVVEELRPDLGPGAAIVARGSVQKVVSALDYYAPEQPFANYRAGQSVRVTARQDAVDAGSWRTWNGRWSDLEQKSLVRFYWSMPFSNMPKGASVLTRNLPHNYPWMIKMAIDTSRGGRLDSTVLYVQSEDVNDWKPAVRKLYGLLKSELDAGVPPMTRPLGRGLSVAEDPVSAASFGEDRCRRIALAVLERPEALHDFTRFVESIQKTFVAAGLDIRFPDRRARVSRELSHEDR